MSRGQLQKLQSDLSKWAAMAALICAAAGWSNIEALLAQLSQQAAAGVRPELLKLMQVHPHRQYSCAGPYVNIYLLSESAL